MKLVHVFATVLSMALYAPAFGQDANSFEFPPSIVPGAGAVAPDAPDAGVTTPPSGAANEAGLSDWTPEDWSAFLKNFVIPLVTLLMGLFGGGIGVRLRDRWSKNKEQKQADMAEAGRIMSMLSNLVPQLHGKVVDGDAKAKKREAALAKAREALDEAVVNGG